VSYLVLARKWRPQTFQDLVGQEHVSRTLQNAIETGRVAHAFLFTGARGVGKTSAARILAKALQCEKGPLAEPCNVCPACIEITAGISVDVFEIDGASNTGVDDIRELRENIKYLPSRCRFRIIIIDEVHMLSTNAFNALLKTLEEPPPHVKFIFATTEPHKVPITILSRCQRFDFKRIPLPKVVARLRHIVDEEKVSISDTSLASVARKGDGSMRDSLSTLDQVLAFCGDEVGDEDVLALLGVVDRRLLLEASQAVFSRNCRMALGIVARVDSFGYNMRQFCQELIDHFRNLTVVKVTDKPEELLELAGEEIAAVLELASSVPLEDLQRHLGLLLKAESEMAVSGFARLILEMTLLKMCTILPVIPVDEILARLEKLEISPVRLEPMAASLSSGTQATNEASPTYRAAGSTSAVPPETRSGAGWREFVSFVGGRKKRIGSILEHGRPLKFSETVIEIGYPAGSFNLNHLSDPETFAVLNGLAAEFWKSSPSVKLVPLNGGTGGLPQSMQEKKGLDMAGRRRELEEQVRSHPVISSAMEIFGGEIDEIIEIDNDSEFMEDKD
jgi:DNA polymerase III subunit gamma/tau